MAVTTQDVLDNAAAIAQLINGAPADVDINALPEETTWADTDFAHIQKAGVDSKILKLNFGPITAKSATKDDDYTILDTDIARAFYLLGAGANKIFTLPTLSANLDKEFLIINLDSDDELQLKGEGAENIIHLGISQNAVNIELQGSGLSVKATSAGWEVTSVVGAELKSISGTLEMIYAKYFLGTTDNDSQTTVVHGEDVDKILSVTSAIWNSVSEYYAVYGTNEVASANAAYTLGYTSTGIFFLTVGTSLRAQNYRIKMEYYI